jgi:DNA-binding FadR family transcriptional regulator
VFYTISGNHFASAAAPLAFYAIAHRLTPPPLAAYARMTAAIAQKDPAQARQAALQALIGE